MHVQPSDVSETHSFTVFGCGGEQGYREGRGKDRQHSCFIESGWKSHEAGSLTHHYCHAVVSWLIVKASWHIISCVRLDEGQGGVGVRQDFQTTTNPFLPEACSEAMTMTPEMFTVQPGKTQSDNKTKAGGSYQ